LLWFPPPATEVLWNTASKSFGVGSGMMEEARDCVGSQCCGNGVSSRRGWLITNMWFQLALAFHAA